MLLPHPPSRVPAGVRHSRLPRSLLAQSARCSVAQPHPLTQEQQAVIRGNLPRAETLYRQKIAQQPKDSELTAGLVRTLLAEQKVDDAESTVKTALAPRRSPLSC